MTPARVKSLVFQLVKAAGGVEAAGAVLGVSHQRVSQLQSLNHADMPTLMQVVALEAFVGHPILTAALAASITSADAGKSPLEEACEVTEAAAELLRLIRTGAPTREIDAVIWRLRKEIDDLPAALATTDQPRGMARP
jgi:hypothetical protein